MAGLPPGFQQLHPNPQQRQQRLRVSEARVQNVKQILIDRGHMGDHPSRNAALNLMYAQNASPTGLRLHKHIQDEHQLEDEAVVLKANILATEQTLRPLQLANDGTRLCLNEIDLYKADLVTYEERLAKNLIERRRVGGIIDQLTILTRPSAIPELQSEVVKNLKELALPIRNRYDDHYHQ